MRTRRPSGFTLIEMLVVITMIAILTALVVPKIKQTGIGKVNAAADLLVNDLEMVRTRSMTARAATRMLFDTGLQQYTGFMDDNGDGVIGQTAAETAALNGLQIRKLFDNVQFGRGAAPLLAGYPGATAVTFANSRVDFDDRGLTTPFGTKGVVYLTYAGSPSVVAAVTVTPGGGIRRWVYKGGAWQ